jgi:molybdenum cofactor cytidylyltransferase
VSGALSDRVTPAALKVAGMILAAGESRRMGRPKALLPFRDGTFLSVLAGVFRPYCAPVIAVFGFDGENVGRSAPDTVLTVLNPDYRLGMLTSLQAGLRACPPDYEAVLFTLVDHPAVLPETLQVLLKADAEIAIPRYRGRRGHPVFMRRAIAEQYLAEPLTAKVRDVIDRHAGSIRYVEVDDPGICDDVDDPALYEALLAREAART